MKQSIDSWVSEKRSAYLYLVLSKVEAGMPHEALFAELASAAEKQALIWAEQATKAGVAVPGAWKPDMRTRLAATLVLWLGPRRVRPVLAALKVRGLSVYSCGEAGHPAPQRGVIERRHARAQSGGNLRAAVFGVNDGIVSNASLMLGIAGANAGGRTILLSGLAGLLAGAFSMAAGEYISVRSQRELFEHQIRLEREELAKYPKEEAAELALIYAARGLSTEEAERLAARIIADPKIALDTLAREELGLNPDDLGSPIGAAISSFFSFATGAALPVLPFAFASSDVALLASVLLAAAALFGVGAALSLFTGRGAIASGLRMVLIGATAFAVTFGIGKLVGVTVG